MKNLFQILFVAIVFLDLACSEVQFQIRSPANSQPPAPSPSPKPDPISPVKPTPVPKPTPSPALPQRTSGICKGNQSLTSCMNCITPEPQKWSPSTKSEKLAQILFLSCSINNNSDPIQYPTQKIEHILSKIQACTIDAYPETPLASADLNTITALLDVNNDYLRRKIFAGLWYQPPYTDHFENYFGAYHADIRKAFCYDADPSVILAGPMMTSEYVKACIGTDNFQCWNWEHDKAAQERWQAVQTIRNQLRNCMNTSANLPPTPPIVFPTPMCEYKTFEGDFMLGGKEDFNKMDYEGYSISVEYKNSCYKPSEINSLPIEGLSGQIKIAGYRCF